MQANVIVLLLRCCSHRVWRKATPTSTFRDTSTGGCLSCSLIVNGDEDDSDDSDGVGGG
jgi:hypothetical protein